MQPIIKVENLSKQYRLGNIGTGTLSHDLKRWYYRTRGWEDPYLKIGESNDRSTKGNSEYVWSLKDINFEVMPGEILGIIGKNGAGKSTLLKILSKVTGPTTGNIHYNGRIASLLEVGTGFHPELTGRENIYLNGAILGMTKTEIKSKLDEIIDFSGVERYIDTPVKRYSSGMMVRLGFAVAAHLEPEILVVDEVLAVGDAEFQKKAIGKMQDVSRHDGRTVLFVSHNMAAMRSLCTKGILLDKGMVAFNGSIVESIQNYQTENFKNYKKIIDKITVKHPDVTVNEILVNDSISDHISVHGNGSFFEVIIRGSLKKSLKICFEAVLFNEEDALLAIFNDEFANGTLKMTNEGVFEIKKRINLPNKMNKGRYHLNFLLVEPLKQVFLSIPKGIIINCEGQVNNSGYIYSVKDAGFINLS